MPGPEAGLLSKRLYTLISRIEGIDPALPPVVIPWVMRHPRYIPGVLRLAQTAGRSRHARARALSEGVRVPPFLVLSVTSKCNLRS